MQYEERALAFACEGDQLYGVATVPAQSATRGVLVVVGGPQYRAGSHRQFTLLARALAQQGIPVMRFDRRGMGDSQGEARSFDGIDADLRCAIDCFTATVPAVREVVLWGLCDGASAAALYAVADERVRGLVLLNPWVRTEESIARTTLKHYYRGRVADPALWKKVAAGRFDLRASVRSLVEQLAHAVRPARRQAATLPGRMHESLSRFDGKVLVVLSGADLTAREFADLALSPEWRSLLAAPRFTRHELAAADHTFSRRAWRDQVAAWTAEWVRSW